MEKELFDWDGWDGDHEIMIFYDAVLKVQIGNHPPGTKFDSAAIDYVKGTLEFYNGEEVVGTYGLKLSLA